MEETYQFLADEVLMVERKVLDGAEDDRVGEDGGIERIGGVLQFIFFHIVFVFSHSCVTLISCGDYTPMIGIIACTS
jgi:hypothetical protein